MPAPQTGYAPINGMQLYYEIHGEGAPLVMLHGGIVPGEMFGAPLAEMAKTHKIVAVHLQGHGFTKDIDRPLQLELLADDVAALLDHLGVAKASVMGYSFGAGTALQLAIRHPEKVDKLISIGVAFRWDGNYAEVVAAFDSMAANAPMVAASITQSPLATMYPDVDWEALFVKMGHLTSTRHDWSADIAKITAPTLLIFADADSIELEHMTEFYKLIGGGQRDAGLDGSLRSSNRLAIIPNTTHYNLMGAKAVTDFATDFLTN